MIPARPAISPTSGKETPGTEIWTNPELPLEQRMSENADKRTHTAQKRIDQERIAKNILLMANSFRKPSNAQENQKDLLITNNNNDESVTKSDYQPE